MHNLLWFDPVLDTQKVFRRVLDCMARPGKIASLFEEFEEADAEWPAISLALTLLDSEATYCVLGKLKAKLFSYAVQHAGSKAVSLKEADFVFVDGAKIWAELRSVQRGDLYYPERGATLILSVRDLSEDAGPGAITLILEGPGIKNRCFLAVTGIAWENLELLKELNSEFPMGVDTILVSDSGRISCLPRSVALQIS